MSGGSAESSAIRQTDNRGAFDRDLATLARNRYRLDVGGHDTCPDIFQ